MIKIPIVAAGYITNIIIDICNTILNLFSGLCNFLLVLIDNIFINGMTFESVYQASSGNESATLGESIANVPAFSPHTRYLKAYMLGSTTYDNVIDFFRYVGIFSAVALFGVSFFLMWRSDGNIKDNAFSAIRKFITAIIVATLSVQLINFIDDSAFSIEKTLVSLTTTTNSESQSFFVESDIDKRSRVMEYATAEVAASEMTDEEYAQMSSEEQAKESLATILGISAKIVGGITVGTALSPILFIICMFLSVFMMGMLVYSYFKLAIELIKRYVSWCLIHMTFPAIAGTLATGYTSNIFWTYVKSYASQSISLIMTYFMMLVTHHLLKQLGMGLVSTFVIMAWINIALQLEQFMKDHGFSISAAGGNLVDNAMASIARMRMATDGVANLAGSTLVTAGAVTGSAPLAQLGNGLKTGDMTAAGGLHAITSSVAGQIMDAIPTPSSSSGNSPLSTSKENALAKMWSQGGQKNMQEFVDQLGRLGEADRNRMFRKIGESLIGNENYGLTKLNGGQSLRYGENFKITGMTRNGGITTEIEGKLGTMKQTISPEALGTSSKQFTNEQGKDFYVTNNNGASYVPDLGNEGISLSEVLENDGEFTLDGINNTASLKGSELDWNSKVNIDDFAEFATGVNSTDASNWQITNNGRNGITLTSNGQYGEAIYSIDEKGSASFEYMGAKGKTYKELLETISRGDFT